MFPRLGGLTFWSFSLSRGGVTIGNGAVIGAGSLVTKDVPENTLAYGVPAKLGKTLAGDEGSTVTASVETLKEALEIGEVPPVGPTNTKNASHTSVDGLLYGPSASARGTCIRRLFRPEAKLSRSDIISAAALAMSCLTCVLALAALLVAAKGAKS